MSVMSALDTEEYELPGAIERDTPIGSKLVLTKWKSKDGEEFWDVDLVYQTADQLRDVTVLSEEDHPGVVDLDLRGLDQNSDGLYTDAAFKGRFADAIGRYDSIKAEYK
jgi:glucose-1-phosphatase